MAKRIAILLIDLSFLILCLVVMYKILTNP
jgi:hypothetical protein